MRKQLTIALCSLVLLCNWMETRGAEELPLHVAARKAVSAAGDLRNPPDNTLKIWDLRTGECLRTLRGHTGYVRSIALLADDRRVVSASTDKTLKAWGLESGREIASFYAAAAMSCCAIAPDGETIVAGDSDGCVYFLRLEGVAVGRA